MKKIFLPIFLLLASPAFSANIPTNEKQQLGQKIGMAVMQQNIEDGATLIQTLFDLQEKYTEERDQKWIQSKFLRLQKIDGLEIPLEEEDLPELPSDQEKSKMIEDPKNAIDTLWNLLGFDSTKKEHSQKSSLAKISENIEQNNAPVCGSENKPSFENEELTDLTQSTFFVVQEKKKIIDELQSLQAEQEKLEIEYNDLTEQREQISIKLENTRYAIALILDKKNQTKAAIEAQRKEKEANLIKQQDEIKALEAQLVAKKEAQNFIERNFKVLNIEDL